MTGRDFRLPLIAASTWLVVLTTIASFLAGAVVMTVGAVTLGALRWVGVAKSTIRAGVALWLLSALAFSVTVTHHGLRSPDALVEASQHSENLIEVVTEKTLTEDDRFVAVSIHQVNGVKVARVSATVFLEPLGARQPPGTRLQLIAGVERNDSVDAKAWRIFAAEAEVIGDAPIVFARADAMREAFLTRSLALGGDGGALLPGLSLGDTQGVSPSLEADMRATALAHLVAVSGANCALVVGIAVVITAALGGGVRARCVVGVVTLIGFVILVTPEPSVIRAAVMATIALAATAWGRPSAGLAVLSLTVWVLLLSDPWRAVEFAFILSVAATAGIVLGLEPTARALSRVMPVWLAWLVSLPLVAQLAVQPVIVLLRPTLPLLGIPANLMAAPFVPAVTVSGLIGSLAEPFAPWLSAIAAALGWIPSSAIAAIARAAALLPGTELPWWGGLGGFLAAAAVSTLFWLGLSRGRLVAGMAASAGIVLGVSGSLIAPQLIARASLPDDWVIAQCDVGQGDALVLRTDAGVLLIDTGDDEVLLRECLRVLGVTRLSHLLLTHFDQDHVGQTRVLHGLVDTVLTGPPDNSEDLRRLSDLASAGADISAVRAGDRIDLGNYVVHVLWPTNQPLGKPGNDSSVVVFAQPLRTEGLSMLALGDLGEQTQTMLRSRLVGGSVDVVKVSHHGSASQSAQLYRDLAAPIALIGVGENNDYGHPAASLLTLLDSVGSHVLRSDQRGTLTLSPGDSGAVELWSERPG